MEIQLRQGNRVIGKVSMYMLVKIMADFKRDGYKRAYEVLQRGRLDILKGRKPIPLTEADAKALHIASGSSDNACALLRPNAPGHYWHGAVLERVPIPG